MQIIVPMSGFGERFRRAGYTVPKPLIEIDGLPVIAHVIAMFPGEADFLFICNREHLAQPSFRMQQVLREHCPTGRIVAIDPHKLGPVHAVNMAMDAVSKTSPVVVNYCDFTCDWSWQDFREFVARTGCEGAIPAYRGFHPHSLGATNYAYIREDRGWIQDIQEKQPFTADRMQEYASSGTYYFESGRVMLDAFDATVKTNLHVNGEHYVSLAYKPMLARGARVAVYELRHFMQWGTPEDVDEYRHWSNTFRLLASPADRVATPPRGDVVVPMAGMGQRFAEKGYAVPKPLIPVSGRPMVVQAARDLPAANIYDFVIRRDLPGFAEVRAEIQAAFGERAKITTVERLTEGQACTALIGVDALEAVGGDGPVTIGACDNGALYDASAFAALLDDPGVDVIVWAARGHAGAIRSPGMYGWIEEVGGVVSRVSVKVPLDDPAHDPIIIGTFTFRRSADFRAAVGRLRARNGRVNGEFYVDECINDAIALGLRCRTFEVDCYLSWGTPNELLTYEYWQCCFHGWPSHPYRLDLDGRVPSESLAALKRRCEAPQSPQRALQP
jgi:NDP-sugar pyrophosphorylase family protein